MNATSHALITAPRLKARRSPDVLPGFGLSLGYTIVYLSLILFIPLAALALKATAGGWHGFVVVLESPRVLASLKLTFGAAFIAALVNAVFGFLVAWVLVRYRFPGRRILDAMVDLPFALPTAVSGIALTAIFSPDGPLGLFLARIGWPVAYTPSGVTIAMVFIGLPFVVRTLQPALEELASELTDAASSLGASPGRVMLKVVLPLTLSSLITGFSLALARGIGEYGSIVFISGNLPFKTEITSLLIITKLEEFDYTGAAVIAVVMLVASFALLLAINLVQRRALHWQARSQTP
ncbi:MAG TPA: sulfate ABC transporter permease subunit CysT [Gammaproteobacteria bacterium]